MKRPIPKKTSRQHGKKDHYCLYCKRLVKGQAFHAHLKRCQTWQERKEHL